MSSKDKNLSLYYGFCIPGQEFSPIIMKSWGLGERASGLIYTQNSLLQFENNLPEVLKMDFLTTDRYKISGESLNDESRLSAFSSARIVVNGPRISVSLKKISDAAVINEIQPLIDNFIRSHIK